MRRFTRRDECKAWAIRDLLTLCAHATEAIGVPVAFGWVIVPQHLTRVTYWDALRHRPMNDAFPDALVQLPDLRRVRVPSFAMEEDHSHQACQWETLEVRPGSRGGQCASVWTPRRGQGPGTRHASGHAGERPSQLCTVREHALASSPDGTGRSARGPRALVPCAGLRV